MIKTNLEIRLMAKWALSESVAHIFAVRNADLTQGGADRFVRAIRNAFRVYHQSYYQREINPAVLSIAIELALKRYSYARKPLEGKDIKDLLPKAREKAAAEFVRSIPAPTEDARRRMLAPLRHAIARESDDMMRQRLEVVADAFVVGGLILGKQPLFDFCLRRPVLYPTKRNALDVMAILHCDYEAIGLAGQEIFVSLDYLEME